MPVLEFLFVLRMMKSEGPMTTIKGYAEAMSKESKSKTMKLLYKWLASLI